ncbi:DUF6229 family protein [Stenotrophomonas sp. 24(2023)]|uniref:DUF6229 family protein n=1 Tax=Stenotrophomonas sp. 24(2023) TaxID=3068324 RepID=UPI0027E0EE00|nr:DUF6229 family protein [Stenotrophomonas sp. 24(2023)]WMJ69301.1 DUF6229 family protein [Stenotrophomonas sp. 24(2023)]
MQMHDDVVSGWLEGADSVDGCDNPAGSLFIHGQQATEAAMTVASAAMVTGGGTMCTTTMSVVDHCLCC